MKNNSSINRNGLDCRLVCCSMSSQANKARKFILKPLFRIDVYNQVTIQFSILLSKFLLLSVFVSVFKVIYIYFILFTVKILK